MPCQILKSEQNALAFKEASNCRILQNFQLRIRFNSFFDIQWKRTVKFQNTLTNILQPITYIHSVLTNEVTLLRTLRRLKTSGKQAKFASACNVFKEYRFIQLTSRVKIRTQNI